ncbi:MAG: PepSY-associated TM helix domain-containing protein [Gammaproteobacteria bacterium]|nr:PepSY-associated TM helix domain-containing protein [Gammaproteobacteria bacterium]
MTLDSPAGNTVIEVFVDQKKIHIDQRQLSVLAMLNNIHRAKHTTGLWLYLSDISAVAMMIFCLSVWVLACSNQSLTTQTSTGMV